MTVRDFCLYNTQVEELCVIRDSGYIIQQVWIDCEDLFAIHPNYTNKEVKNNCWGELEIITQHGDKIKIPCHYIDV